MAQPDTPLGGAPVFRIETGISFDRDKGVFEVADFLVRDQINVRQNLVDERLRAAIIIELERLGYTIISPETEQ